MERYRQSQVRHSTVISSGTKQFVSSSMVGESIGFGDDLRKSRIQNLPNYRKTNLGDNKNFIVVFQAIQIQRLTNQIQILRIKVKEYERQIFNSQNYEVQIRQLTEKCFAYERERQRYMQELENMNKVCENLYNENEVLKRKINEMDITLQHKYQSEKNKNMDLIQQLQKWKSRYQSCENNKAKQLEDLRNFMDCQSKSQIDREVREMSIRFQNQRSNFQNQIRKLREMLDNRNKEIQEFKQRCQRYQISITELKNYQNIIADNENKILAMSQQLLRLNESLRNKDKNIEGKSKDYQHKINLLTQQIQSLNTLIRDKNKTIQNFQQQQLQLHHKLTYYKNFEHRAAELQHTVNRLQEEIKNLKRQVDNFQQKYKEYQLKSRELENSLNNIIQEKDRLSIMLKNKSSQYENLRNRYADLEDSMRKTSKLEMVCQEQHNQIMSYVSDLENVQKTLRARQEELDKERNICNDLACKVIVYSLQLERIGKQGISKNSKQFIEMQESITKLHAKNQTKNQEIQHLNQCIASLQSRISKLMMDFNDLLRKVQSSQQETLMLTRKIQEYQDYAKRITILGAEIDRLTIQNRSLDQDAKNLRLKYAYNLGNEKKQEGVNLALVLMGLQIQSLRSRLDSRVVNEEQMRKSILNPVRKI